MARMPPMPPMPPMAMPPPPPSGATPSPPMPPMPMPMPMPGPPMPPMDMPTMHAAFFWGHRAQVLFPNWPGNDRAGFGMYVLCLVVVAEIAALAEVLAAWSRALATAGDAPAGWTTTTLQVCVHVLKVGLSYLAMLAVMSFNGGVFLAVVAGHASGFLIAQNWTKLRRRVTAAAAREDGGVHRTNGGGGAVPPSSSSEEPRP